MNQAPLTIRPLPRLPSNANCVHSLHGVPSQTSILSKSISCGAARRLPNPPVKPPSRAPRPLPTPPTNQAITRTIRPLPALPIKTPGDFTASSIITKNPPPPSPPPPKGVQNVKVKSYSRDQNLIMATPFSTDPPVMFAFSGQRGVRRQCEGTLAQYLTGELGFVSETLPGVRLARINLAHARDRDVVLFVDSSSDGPARAVDKGVLKGNTFATGTVEVIVSEEMLRNSQLLVFSRVFTRVKDCNRHQTMEDEYSELLRMLRTPLNDAPGGGLQLYPI